MYAIEIEAHLDRQTSLLTVQSAALPAALRFASISAAHWRRAGASGRITIVDKNARRYSGNVAWHRVVQIDEPGRVAVKRGRLWGEEGAEDCGYDPFVDH